MVVLNDAIIFGFKLVDFCNFGQKKKQSYTHITYNMEKKNFLKAQKNTKDLKQNFLITKLQNSDKPKM